MKSWPTKDPDDFLDYTLDWALRLDAGETVQESSFSVVEGEVEIRDFGFEPTGLTTVWLTGGLDGERCIILNRIITSQGRTYDQSVRLRVRSK